MYNHMINKQTFYIFMVLKFNLLCTKELFALQNICLRENKMGIFGKFLFNIPVSRSTVVQGV